MISIYTWIADNWQMIIPIGVLLFLLSISGNITRMVRDAKDGLKQAMTPLGFAILIAIAFLGYQIYLSIMATI